MVKKIVVIVILAVLCLSSIKLIISESSELSYTVDVYSKYKSGEYTNGSITANGDFLDVKEHMKYLKGLIFESFSFVVFYVCIDVISAIAIYELIRSIRHPMRYAVEGAQQNYADYKAWRDTVRADREAAQRAARRAELERELAELEKTE